ncbi:MAG: DUF4864 domain-containing protein [Armatimonadetes bacterium]|nr:DUF4864 domain-containing protein [Armatimonadota bacterium]
METLASPPTETAPAPPVTERTSRGRILLYALAPLLLLALLTGAVRLVTNAEQKEQALQETGDAPRRNLQSVNPSRMLPAPRPPVLKPADPETRTALETVVRSQLQAIAAQDFAKALSFAVAPLRGSTNPQAFRTVIEAGYAPMLSMKRVEIVNARVQTVSSSSKKAMVDVVVVTRSGEKAEYGYMLQQAGEGWQVQGVMLRVPPPMPDGQEEGTARPLSLSPVL